MQLRVRGDNVTALTLLLKLRPPANSPGLVLIAREMALDISDATYRPQVLAHVPGLSNVSADTLSRKFAPATAPWSVPPCLQDATMRETPARDAAYFRTLGSPVSDTRGV